eukprot:9288904-Karenia_brevis.AAC.1
MVPTLVFVGDFYQLPSISSLRAYHSPLYNSWSIAKRELHTMRRCKCSFLRKKLQLLRTGKPSVKQLRWIKRGHYAVPPRSRDGSRHYEPSMLDIQSVYDQAPHTTFVTITRRAAAR